MAWEINERRRKERKKERKGHGEHTETLFQHTRCR